jgi:hypothetical protein
VAGLVNIKGGDDRFYNNIFVGRGAPASAKPGAQSPQHAAGFGLYVYDNRPLPLQTGGNVYYHGARPYAKETSAIDRPGFDPKVRLVSVDGRLFVLLSLDDAAQKASTTLVTTGLLGQAAIPKLPYERPDGAPICVNTDYLGKTRSESRPTPGPLENPGTGPLTIQVR